jgi:GLPGLI family protein
MKRKKGLFCLLLITAAGVSFAQDTISLNVLYEYRYIRDLAQKDNPYINNMVLSLGKNTSRFCTEKQYKDNARTRNARKRQQQIQSQIKQAPGTTPTNTAAGGLMLLVDKWGAIVKEEITKDFLRQKLEIVGYAGIKTYSAETDLPKIKWALQPEKKQVGKYTCQRALGTYAGREYEAWFTPDLPYHDGPWKLNGLPGLILEAHDTRNEVVFTFKGINKNEDPEETVVSYLKSPATIEASLKDYNRVMASYQTDPEAMLLAAFPNAGVHVFCTDTSHTNSVVKIKKYNPVEKN